MFPTNFISLFWDEGVGDLAAGKGRSCGVTSASHGQRVSPNECVQRSLLPLSPDSELTPAISPEFMWDDAGGLTTGWGRSCSTSSPGHGYVSALLGVLRPPPPFRPEFPPASLPELISPICDERIRATTTGPACSCNVTFPQPHVSLGRRVITITPTSVT